MPPDWAILRLWEFAAVLARAAGFAAVAPALDGRSHSVRYRLAVAVILTLLLFPPSIGSVSGPIQGAAEPIGILLSGLSAGLMYGFALRLVLAALVAVARLVDQQLGLPSPAEMEESLDQSPLARLYQLTAMLTFVCIGGHRLVLEGLLDSSPHGDWANGQAAAVLQATVVMVAEAWWGSIRLAAPMLLTLLTANLLAGMVARLLPQFPTQALAVPMQISLGLALALLAIGGVCTQLNAELLRLLVR